MATAPSPTRRLRWPRIDAVRRHWRRVAITLVPLAFALLHASTLMPIGFLQRLDDILYDARLRAAMPRTLDDRIVIVDIDEKSLGEVGRWPWSRHHMARLIDELFDRQGVAVVGFDVVATGARAFNDVRARYFTVDGAPAAGALLSDVALDDGAGVQQNPALTPAMTVSGFVAAQVWCRQC